VCIPIYYLRLDFKTFFLRKFLLKMYIVYVTYTLLYQIKFSSERTFWNLISDNK